MTEKHYLGYIKFIQQVIFLYYLNTFLEGGKPEVSELLIPSDTVPADKSQGLYDAKKLALSNSVELILSQAKDTPVPRNQFNEAVMKYSEEYMKKGAKKIAGETSVTTYELVDSIIKGKDIPSATISLITDEKVETAITSFINKVHIRYANNEFTRNILSDKALKDKFTQMVEDSFEVKNFFGAPNGKSITRILLSSKFDTNVSIAQEVSPLLAKAASERNIAVETRYYKGETHYFVEENSYREFQQQVHTETDDYLKKLDEQNKLKTKNLIDKKQYEELKNTSIGSLRFKFVKGIMESCYGTYSAIDELNEKLQKLQQTEGVDNAIVCLGLYKQVFDIQKNCVEIVNKWNNHKLSMMLKVVPCTELFGSIETETTKKIDNLMTKKKDISQLLKMNDVVTGTLGLGISTLQLIQSVRSLAESMNQNDEHIIRADMANFINAGATTVSSAKAIADTLKDQAREKLKDIAIENRAKKNLAKQGGEAFAKGAANVAEKTGTKAVTEKLVAKGAIAGIERVIGGAAAFLAIPYLGEY
ncbi:hypothetical protein [Francisella marina]|uniref:Uncharacterized protein n=1 Tax=Francisella marina TaxID=2249302 RepID=A0ABX5ZFP9_9GAMM|nr:hypothetical protein [Francisella marina]QEO57002.1 hypothetical protein F0R74_03720 [Francisella marina]QEO58881.1 hypothetical protein F0R75_03505 [Francisella marina]